MCKDEQVHTIEIIVNLTITGYHQWDNPPPPLEFLSYLHRHNFEIECRKLVVHEDRDIEIITFKTMVEYFLYNSFPEYLDGVNFKNASCETIARFLVQEFGLSYCKVLEDGENGAVIKS